MKTFLFLDDWFLDSKIDIVRRFPKAVAVPITNGCHLAYSAIIWDEEKKEYLAAIKMKPQDKKPSLYGSKDGTNWEKTRNPKFQFLNQPEKEVLLPVSFPFEQGFFYDKWDSNPDRRYKMLLWPYSNDAGTGPSGIGIIGCSPDGLNWTIDPKYTWYRALNHADTNNNMFYNPFTKKWCVVCRKINLDRRVAITESGDLENWTKPRVIIQPDVLDNPFLQFYGMAATLYEDEYFIGIVQGYNVPMQEINSWSKGRVKMQGSVDTQLTYSYDGEYWLRSDRSNIIPRTEPGSYGCGCIYPSAIVNSPDSKKIYIYSIGTLWDHEKGGQIIPPGYPSEQTLMLHTLRHDGFACLEPIGGWGQFITKTIIPNSGELTVNYHAPLGQILVQLTDSERKPLPGYAFSDCVPLEGDEIHGKVCWKKHKGLVNLIGKPIRLEFRLFDARIYAVRLDCNLWYSYWPEAILSKI